MRRKGKRRKIRGHVLTFETTDVQRMRHLRRNGAARTTEHRGTAGQAQRRHIASRRHRVPAIRHGVGHTLRNRCRIGACA
eukprot:scaffold363_cov331-Pavlova_lutheri.AAC.2